MSNETTPVNGVIEVQNGVGNGARDILDLTEDVQYALGGIDTSFGGITRNYRISPRTHKAVPRPVRRDAPEAITAELSCKMRAWNYMEQFDADSRLALYVRRVNSAVTNPLRYDRVDILNDVALEGINFGDMVTDEPSTDDVTITFPLNAAAHVRIDPVVGKRLTTGLTNSVDVDKKAVAIDEDGTIYVVTAAESTPGPGHLLISPDDGATWTETTLTDMGNNAMTSVVIAGDYLIIAASTKIGVYNKSTQALVTSYTSAQAINALFAIDAAHIVGVGAAGHVIYTDDAGSTWTALTSGSAVAFSSVACRSLTEWYIGGATGTLLRYDRGTFVTVTLPAALSAATITTIALPDGPTGFSRDETVYIGASIGVIYASPDRGDTWSEIGFPGDGSGSVSAIAFTEFLGQVLYVVHTLAGGASVVYRDWSGGAGGLANMEQVTVPTNSGLNAIAVVDANNAIIVGDTHSASDMLVKVER